MYQPGDLVDEMREALRRAESFGDICGIITAQFAYGTTLLRADDASRDEAIEVLEHARASIVKHKVMTTNLMPAIGADLAIDAARKGRRSEAIDDLRALSPSTWIVEFESKLGCTGEALDHAAHRSRNHRRLRRGAPNRRRVGGPGGPAFPRRTCGG